MKGILKILLLNRRKLVSIYLYFSSTHRVYVKEQKIKMCLKYKQILINSLI